MNPCSELLRRHDRESDRAHHVIEDAQRAIRGKRARSGARSPLRMAFLAALVAGSASLREPALGAQEASSGPRSALVRGRVSQAGSAEPCAGARIRCARPGVQLERGKPVETVARADGSFELAGVPLGATVLLVEYGGRGTVVDGPFELTGELSGGGLERRIELGGLGELGEPSGGDARVHGRLLDAAGRALPRETIALWTAHADQRSTLLDSARTFMTTTDEQGAFELASLPAGIYHLGWMRELGEIRARDLWHLVILGNGSVVGLDLAPRGGATLRGKLESRGTLPDVVEIVVLEVPTADHSLPRRGRGAFAVKGSFELTHLEPGTYSVAAFPLLADGTGSSLLLNGVEILADRTNEVQLLVPAPR